MSSFVGSYVACSMPARWVRRWFLLLLLSELRCKDNNNTRGRSLTYGWWDSSAMLCALVGMPALPGPKSCWYDASRREHHQSVLIVGLQPVRGQIPVNNKVSYAGRRSLPQAGKHKITIGRMMVNVQHPNLTISTSSHPGLARPN